MKLSVKELRSSARPNRQRVVVNVAQVVGGVAVFVRVRFVQARREKPAELADFCRAVKSRVAALDDFDSLNHFYRRNDQ